MKNNKISAYAPASIGNVSVGFDCLGLALTQPGDTVSIENGTRPGIHLVRIEGDLGRLPKKTEENVVGVVIRSMLERLGRYDAMAVTLTKGLPLKSGLGSSAASSVAAAVAANAFLGEPFTKEELLPFAMEGERLACGAAHADNVAPALLGGITLIRPMSDPPDIIRIPFPKDLWCAVVHPDAAVATRDARAVLPELVPRDTAIRQSAYLAAFVTGLQQHDTDLISRSMVDLIAEPARKHLIPHFDEVREAALRAGALGCGISGSGPTLFALCKGKRSANRTAKAMGKVYNVHQLACETYISGINAEGAVLL
ncbi:MAG: homoserine kinase [Candidatus Marinimicrobia bacterium]|nr:homoserine kinase [Candidatus Neomarinimicrobiota bacterium]